MRAWAFALAAILSCGSAQGTAAANLQPKPRTVSYYPGLRAPAELRVHFAPNAATVTPGQIAVCANLAALRAFGAKASGVDYANQSRIADLTFVLCLAGSPTQS